jgi:SpoIID/LytB domain protein
MRKPIALALLLLVAAASAAGEGVASAGVSQVGSGRSFTFYGSGFGHGVGMSQWGAYGLARRGWGYRRILAHYYRGVRIRRTSSGPSSLRVGLTWNHRSLHLSAAGGPVVLEVRRRTVRGMRRIGIIRSGATWTLRPSRGRYVVTNSLGRRVGGRRWGDRVHHLYADPGRGARVFVREASHWYNRGRIEFNLYQNCTGCTFYLRAIAVLRPQAYLYGLGEVPSSWPMAAMKAQAVAARTYAFAVVQGGQHRGTYGPCNCGLYDSTYDQVYAGWDKENDGPRWPQAVRRTAGQIIRYRGELIRALYSSSSGGYTESNEDRWFTQPVPYLRAVCDPGDYTRANPVRTWKKRLTGLEVLTRLASYGYNVGVVTSFSRIDRSVSGRIMWLTVNGTGGWNGRQVRISGATLAAALGLMDRKVWINVDKNVVGPIRRKYDSLQCRPGLPMRPRHPVARGLVQAFARGRIYYRRGPGSHYLYGRVLAYYLGKRGPRGRLGFPTSDIRRLSGGRRRATFQHGTVTCRADGRCTRRLS